MLLRQILVHHGQHLFYVGGVENKEKKKSRGILVDRPWFQHRHVCHLPVWGLLDLVYAETINDMVYLSGATCVGRNASFSHTAVVSSYLPE